MKFRVWDKKEKKFVRGVLMDSEGDFFHEKWDHDDGNVLSPVEVMEGGELRFEVSFFTGYKASDGTEIYEGDFVCAYKPRGEEYEGKMTLIDGEWWMWDEKFQEYFSKKLSDIPKNFEIKIIKNNE